MLPAAPRPRGRPRDDGIDARVLSAVVEELFEVGVSGFSVNSVCARAGVSKRSVATRWPDRELLIVAGLHTLAAGLAPPKTGELSDDLSALASQIIEMTAEPRRSILARCAAELKQHPQYYEAYRRDSFDRCIAVVEDALFDARGRGELRGDVDPGLAADCFASAILGSRSFGNLPPEEADRVSRQLVDIFVRGITLT
jgi:AcrR family transcriptional regulator